MSSMTAAASSSADKMAVANDEDDMHMDVTQLPSSVDECTVEFVLRHDADVTLSMLEQRVPLLQSLQLLHTSSSPPEAKHTASAASATTRTTADDSALATVAQLRDAFAHSTHWRHAYDATQAAVRACVCEAKDALAAYEPAAYIAARDALLPLSVTGTADPTAAFSNRAGHKLLECMDAAGVWQQLQHVQEQEQQQQHGDDDDTQGRRRKRRRVAFVDVCGGPGAFAEALLTLGKQYQLRWRGYGITLAGVKGLDWYASLRQRGFVISYGIDGTGDVFRLANLCAFASLAAPARVCLVVADGGFHVEAAVANWQETISSRILFAQWLLALRVLRVGGCLVLKLFDSFAPFTRAVLYLSTLCFARVHVVKPRHSRVVNSERYLVCVDFAGTPSPAWMTYFDACLVYGFVPRDAHAQCEHAADAAHDVVVPELLPPSLVLRDATFMRDVRAANAAIARRQVAALRMIVRHMQTTQADA